MIWHEYMRSLFFAKPEAWATKSVATLSQLSSSWIWMVLWISRPRADPTKWTDLTLFIGYQFLTTIYALWSSSEVWLVSKRVIVHSTITTLVLVICLTITALLRSQQKPRSRRWTSVECDTPLLHRCQTTHSRMFPRKHTFSYRYLQISVPVQFEGTRGRMISVGKQSKSTFFHVDPSAYLERHCNSSTLQGRLEAYLKSKGVPCNAWDHAFLVTAPKFLGYSFNPVSFWYIYDKADNLAMMILEVNNTFDERRIYLLANEPDSFSSTAQSEKFKHYWEKDFHVSPFNSRKGHYSLTALNPFQKGKFRAPGIDNNITLKSSKGHSKLVARLFSNSNPIDPQDFPLYDFLSLILQWCWLGFFTFPRIIKEAIVLFFNHRLHVWLRPEVQNTSQGRRATSTEKDLESFLFQNLSATSQACKNKHIIEYQTGFTSHQILPNSEVKGDGKVPNMIVVKILSPEFFVRLIHYTTVTAALRAEGLLAAEKSRTVHISHPEILFDEVLSNETKPGKIIVTSGLADQIRWQLLNYLRCPPSTLAYSRHDTTVDRLDYTGFSSLDKFVAENCQDGWRYRRHASRLLLAQRVAFGFEEIIVLLDFAVRAYLVSTAGLASCAVHFLELCKG